MSNHFHILLEVPPMPEGGISDVEILKGLSATNTEAFVAVVAKELAEARAGLVRACMSHQGAGFEAEKWKDVSRIYRRTMGLALARKRGKAEVAKGVVRRQMNTAEALEAQDNGTALPDLKLAAMLRCRVRYFTDGAVIGSKAFVNETFALARDRFTDQRKDGARRMKGNGGAAAGVLCSLRDLRVRV